MRKSVAAAILVLAGAIATVGAQGESSANFLNQAFVRVTDSASAAAKLGNFGYDEGVSILGAWVHCRDNVMYYVPLTRGVNYMFVAGGDNDAQDIDLEIQDDKGRVVAVDNRVAADAMATLAAPSTGWFTLKLTLAKSRKDFPCVCVVAILKENGLQVPLKNLDVCSARLMRLFTDTDKLLQKEGKRLEFRWARNQWGLYGSVLRPGDDISVTNLNLGSGRRLLLAMGDEQTEDVDLSLLDKANAVVAEDVKTNPEAIIGYTPEAAARYGIRMRNYKGNGPSVIMTGIFDVLQAK